MVIMRVSRAGVKDYYVCNYIRVYLRMYYIHECILCAYLGISQYMYLCKYAYYI